MRPERDAVETPSESASWREITRRLGAAAADRAEEIIAEAPATIRRLRTLLLVLSVTIPLFLVAIVVVLWRLAS